MKKLDLEGLERGKQVLDHLLCKALYATEWIIHFKELKWVDSEGF